jgi:hypothetical protein
MVNGFSDFRDKLLLGVELKARLKVDICDWHMISPFGVTARKTFWRVRRYRLLSSLTCSFFSFLLMCDFSYRQEYDEPARRSGT